MCKDCQENTQARVLLSNYMQLHTYICEHFCKKFQSFNFHVSSVIKLCVAATKNSVQYLLIIYNTTELNENVIIKSTNNLCSNNV